MRSDLRGNRVEIGPLAGLEFGVDEFTQTVQYSIVTSDFTRASFIFFTLCARAYAVER